MTTYAINENNTARTDSQDGTPADGLMPLILIVEDDRDNRQMLKYLLEMWTYRVIEAADGLEAVSIAEKTRPDLVLMDVKLPKLDGFETTRRFRQSESLNRIPIIFTSGCAEEINRRTAADAGADGYLIKPLDFALLENTVEKYAGSTQSKSFSHT